ncbi:retention module-containing protein, partial [Undibacterium sp. Ren11W]|uniref:retention module-containing protein n=6 Tax=Undibacterium sp. Ren11W TaxID=3413045 RepID=UPI003BF0FDD6
MASSANIVGKVVALQGQAIVRSSDGSQHQLHLGDVIYENDVIVTEANGRVELAFDQGRTYLLREGETVTLDASVFAPAQTDITNAALLPDSSLASSVANAVIGGNSLDKLLEETAAGLGGGEVGDGNDFVQLDRIAEAVTPQSFFASSATTTSILPVERSAGLLANTIDTTPPVLSVNAPDNTNDSTPTIFGVSDLPVGSTITLVVTDNAGTSQTITATIQAGGIYSATPTTPLADGSYKVIASGRDAAGNLASSSDDGSVDTTATAAPTVTITTDSNNDGLISKTELGAATTVAVSVALPGTAKAGDTLTITDGTTPQSHVLTAAEITAGTYSTSVAKPAEGANLTVTATVTDIAGNVSAPGTDSTVLDTTATAAPTITITTDSNNDGLISKTEQGAATTVAVTVALPGTAKAGDTLTITDGTTPQSHVLTAAEITAGTYSSTVAKPAEGANLTVTATVTDQAGNVSAPGTDSATLDTTATAAPTITITTDSNNDGLISKTELGAATTVAVTVALPGTAKAGDTLTITDGTTPQSHVLTAAEITTGTYSTTVAKLAEGATLSVSATVTDQAGNVSAPGTDSAVLDTTATAAPTITITTDSNNDGLISKTELGAATTVAVTVALPGTAKAGDTLTITDGTTPQSHVLTAAEITAGTYSTTVAKPAEGATLSVSATVTDQAGNVSAPGTDAATLVTVTNDAPTITITTDSNNDGLISKTELGAATTVAVTVALPGTAKAGDTLTITDGTTPQSHVLTAAEITAGTYSSTVAKPAEGSTLSVTATVT